MQPVKAAPYTTHAQFSDPDTILKLPAPPDDLVLVDDDVPLRARGRACAAEGRGLGAGRDRRARAHRARAPTSSRSPNGACRPKEIVQTARLVATGRLADANGRPRGARQGLRGRDLHRGLARVHGAAVLVLPDPPVARLGATAPRASSTTRKERSGNRWRAWRGNGWALAGLVETHHRKGDAAAERHTRRAYAKAWLGDPAGPSIAAL